MMSQDTGEVVEAAQLLCGMMHDPVNEHDKLGSGKGEGKPVTSKTSRASSASHFSMLHVICGDINK